jgi:hypothetical protein
MNACEFARGRGVIPVRFAEGSWWLYSVESLNSWWASDVRATKVVGEAGAKIVVPPKYICT